MGGRLLEGAARGKVGLVREVPGGDQRLAVEPGAKEGRTDIRHARHGCVCVCV